MFESSTRMWSLPSLASPPDRKTEDFIDDVKLKTGQLTTSCEGANRVSVDTTTKRESAHVGGAVMIYIVLINCARTRDFVHICRPVLGGVCKGRRSGDDKELMDLTQMRET